MPYITTDKREHVEKTRIPEDPGELNYVLLCICMDYLLREGLRYDTLSEVIGALECVKTEFYRRIVVPYEERKLAKRGDVIYPALKKQL